MEASNDCSADKETLEIMFRCIKRGMPLREICTTLDLDVEAIVSALNQRTNISVKTLTYALRMRDNGRSVDAISDLCDIPLTKLAEIFSESGQVDDSRSQATNRKGKKAAKFNRRGQTAPSAFVEGKNREEKKSSSLARENETRQGTKTWPNGDEYQGELLNDVPHGKGTMKHAAGETYICDWVNGVKQGRGKEIHPNGATYEGEFTNDLANGHGTFNSADGTVYKGSWKEDKRHGHGETTWANGDRFEGEYEKDLFNGSGTVRYADGRVYAGSYKDGKFNGRGVYTWPNGDRFEGEWINNCKTDGTCKYADGSVFTGLWKDGKHQKGTFTWPNGGRYEGEFDNSFRSGSGTYKWPDGRVHIGLWKEGKRHGLGVEVEPDGGKYTGTWKDDTKDGDFMYSRGATLRLEKWSNGQSSRDYYH
jgi:hypothetical protein